VCGIIDELEDRVKIYKSAWCSIVAGRTVATQVLLGLVGYLVAAGGLFLLLYALIPDWWQSVASRIYLGGSLGGIMSVVIRIQDIALLSRWAPEADPRLLFYTGLLKPAAGVVFAFFVWAAVRTEFISITITSTLDNSQLAFALAFIAGFTERFAPDIANRTIPPPDRDKT
jgi:hypothetical protein